MSRHLLQYVDLKLCLTNGEELKLDNVNELNIHADNSVEITIATENDNAYYCIPGTGYTLLRVALDSSKVDKDSANDMLLNLKNLSRK